MHPIIRLVARKHNVSARSIVSTSRQQTVVRARDEVCSLLDGEGFSLPEIGCIVKRDHTSVLDAIERRHLDLGYPLRARKLKLAMWAIEGSRTRDGVWQVENLNGWRATNGAKTLKAMSQVELEMLLAREYAQRIRRMPARGRGQGAAC